MVDITKTRSQAKVLAAQLLAVIEPGETLSTEDNETLDDFVDPLVAQLSSDDIADIPNTEEIDVQYFLPFCRLLANVAGPAFGSPINAAAKAKDEEDLRRITSTRPTYEVMKGHYF